MCIWCWCICTFASGFSICAFDICAFDICAFDVCAFDICAFDICAFDTGVCDISAFDTGAFDICACTLHCRICAFGLVYLHLRVRDLTLWIPILCLVCCFKDRETLLDRLARELTSRVQKMRKSAALKLEDAVEVFVSATVRCGDDLSVCLDIFCFLFLLFCAASVKPNCYS